METFRWAGWRDEAKKVVGSVMDKAYVGPSIVFIDRLLPDSAFVWVNKNPDLITSSLRKQPGAKKDGCFRRLDH